MTPEEKSAYNKEWYRKNKERLLAKSKSYYEENGETVKARQREYYAENKEAIDARQKLYRDKTGGAAAKNYYQTHKETLLPKMLKQKKEKLAAEKSAIADGDLLGAAAAGQLLGVTTNCISAWASAGKLPSVKVGRFRRFHRRDLESLKIAGQSSNGTHQLKMVKTVGEFAVPENFDLITTYDELSEYTQAFAAKKFSFLLLVGSPGSGKSRQMKADLDGKGVVWIDNHVTNLGLYCAVYEGHNKPVVLDDVNHFLANKQACSLLKALTQTDEIKSISWESTAKALEDREVPRSYTTSCPVCMIGNQWDMSNADYAAIQDRALPVAFYPNAETIHAQVIKLGFCDDSEIIQFIGDSLALIPQPSMREYYVAKAYKRAGMDWKKKLLAIWGQT